MVFRLLDVVLFWCSALQTDADYPGLVNALVDCLERIFKTKYGASLIPHYMVVSYFDY